LVQFIDSGPNIEARLKHGTAMLIDSDF